MNCISQEIIYVRVAYNNFLEFKYLKDYKEVSHTLYDSNSHQKDNKADLVGNIFHFNIRKDCLT